MARGNSRTRRRLAKAKAELHSQYSLLAEGYNRRDALIRSNLASSKAILVDTGKVTILRDGSEKPVLTKATGRTARTLRGEGFASSAVLVEQGGHSSRGVRQWGTTPGAAQRIAAKDIEPSETTVTVDTSIPVKPVFAKDQPLYPVERKFSKETGKFTIKGQKRFSQK